MADDLDFGRRAMLAGLAALIGAASLPADALAAPSGQERRFLAAPHFALLASVADTMIPATDTPGAIAADVPARIDGLLHGWASADTRSAITGILTRIDAAALAQRKKGFAALSAEEREEVLRQIDADALRKVPPPPGAPKANFFVQAEFVADPGYLKLKDLVLRLYYFSEVAASSELIYEHVPGQWQPSIKLTPQSRPYLGTGPF